VKKKVSCPFERSRSSDAATCDGRLGCSGAGVCCAGGRAVCVRAAEPLHPGVPHRSSWQILVVASKRYKVTCLGHKKMKLLLE